MAQLRDRLTTAQCLGAYRRELIEQGFTEEQAELLVRQAADALVRDYGLGVSEELAHV